FRNKIPARSARPRRSRTPAQASVIQAEPAADSVAPQSLNVLSRALNKGSPGDRCKPRGNWGVCLFTASRGGPARTAPVLGKSRRFSRHDSSSSLHLSPGEPKQVREDLVQRRGAAHRLAIRAPP